MCISVTVAYTGVGSNKGKSEGNGGRSWENSTDAKWGWKTNE